MDRAEVGDPTLQLAHRTNPDYRDTIKGGGNSHRVCGWARNAVEEDREPRRHLHTVARLIRNDVLALVEGQEFLLGLRNMWTAATDSSRKTLGELMLSELRAFPPAFGVARTQETTATEEKGWIQRWPGRASIVTGSVKDIIDNLPPLVKGGLTILGELLDLFRGNRSIEVEVD